MKKLILALSISCGFASAAIAQNVAPAFGQKGAAIAGGFAAPAAAAPVTAGTPLSAPILPVPIPSITPTEELKVPELHMKEMSSNPNVNPFSGQMVSDEEMKRDLERTRRQTQAAEELLKQTNINNELTAATMRKNVEIAQSKTALQKEHNAQIELRSVLENREAERLRITKNYEAEVKRQEEEFKARVAKEAADKKKAEEEAAKNKLSPTAAAERRRAEAAAIKAAAELKESQAKAVAQAKPTILPGLVSTMAISGTKVAILDEGGKMVRFTDGDQTPYGLLRVVSADTVTLGGQKVVQRGDTTTRFIASDVNNNDQDARSAPRTVSAPPVTAMPAPTPSPAPSASMGSAPKPTPTPTGGSGVSMPTLKLPPPIPR